MHIFQLKLLRHIYLVIESNGIYMQINLVTLSRIRKCVLSWTHSLYTSIETMNSVSVSNMFHHGGMVYLI